MSFFDSAFSGHCRDLEITNTFNGLTINEGAIRGLMSYIK